MVGKKASPEPGTIVLTYPSGRVEKTACNRFDKKFKAKVEAVNKLNDAGGNVKWHFTKKPQHEIDAENAVKKRERDKLKGKPD